MRCFTNNPYERTMMQAPHRPRPSCPVLPPKGTPATAANGSGEVCVLPCHRGVMQHLPARA